MYKLWLEDLKESEHL